ncbi:MAG: beta-galactosidase [Phycisphaerales bacterium]|nr:beta-galactosidase [Phycisphaerales bacterium]
MKRFTGSGIAGISGFLMWRQFYYGVCYYPEHWPAEKYAEDIQRIAAAGFNMIRMGESAWSYWEPREGEYQFDIFDRVIDLCRRHGIHVVMGTPTYSAPAWAATNYPEILRWDFNRVPMAHGSRRNLNYTSPKYLELSDRICTALAEHYRDETQIIAWQLDNEFNCHMDVSYAPSDTRAFRRWLEDRYTTLDQLNAAWGTAFWSQTYTDWEQIDLPHPTATKLNPHQLLDETRFISDCVVQFARRQADILRRVNKRWPITHNGIFGNIDGQALAKPLDFFSHDQYPLFAPDEDWPWAAWGLVQARSLSYPFAIMEQQAGPGGQMSYVLRTPRPGQLRLWAMQSVAHGAKLISYFRWRSCPYGSEQHWHGLLRQDNGDTRWLDEASRLGGEIKHLGKAFFDSTVECVAAVLREFDNETDERRINTYVAEGQFEYSRWLAELSRQHISADMIWSRQDWNDYPLLIAPHLKIVDKTLVRKLTQYVRQGGTLILGAQSGSMDRHGHIVQQPLPGLLQKLCGVEIEDWTTLEKATHRTARLAGYDELQLNVWVERLRPCGAATLAEWNCPDALLHGAVAMTRHQVGKGSVIYIGGYCPSETVRVLVGWLSKQLALPVHAKASADVEVIVRTSKEWLFLVLLNHAASTQIVTGLPAGRELLRGQAVEDGRIVLDKYGVAVVQCRR